MIKLQHLNVVKFAETEEQAKKLMGKGFKVVEQEDISKETGEKPLGKMNKEELLAKADELGIEIPEGATKAEIIKAIEGEYEIKEFANGGSA